MDWIYRTFLNPLSVLDDDRPPLPIVAMVVLGGGFGLMLWVPNMALSPLSIAIFLMIHMVVWVFQSMVLDLCAQLLGHSAPRLSMLIGMGMSNIYLWCLVPLRIIQETGWPGTHYIGLIGFLGVILGVLTLTQWVVVKSYDIPFIRSFLVLALPWIAGGAFIGLIVGIIGLPSIVGAYFPT